MDAILINRVLSQPEILEIRKRVEGSDCKLFSMLDMPSELSGIKLEPLNLNPSDKKLLFTQTLNALLEFGDKQVSGKAISEWFTFGSMPLWHYQRFRIFFPLRNMMYELSELKQIASLSDNVTCFTSSNLLSEYPDLPSNIELRLGDSSDKKKTNYRVAAVYTCFAVLRFIIGAFQMMNLRGKQHLILDRSEKQACFDPVTFRSKPDNYNLSYLLDSSGKRFMILSEVDIPKFDTASNFRLHGYHFWQQDRMSRTIYSEYILFSSMIRSSVIKEKQRILGELALAIEKIGKAPLTSYENLIFLFFVRLQRTNGFYISKHLAYLRFFKNHRFETVSCIDENSPSVRCILDAGRAEGAKTIGIQHGNIGDAQPAYLFTSADRQNRIMADHTLVWGEYWKQFLITKGHYPTESIHVIGQMRTDVIPRLKESGMPDMRQNLAGGKSLVIFASQPQPDANLRRQAAFDVFDALKDEKDVFIVVKLHPAERYSFEYYNTIAREVGCLNYKLVYDIDLYRLIAACQVLITCYSTVGTEAIYFGKPLIILDHLREDLLGYQAEGVAMQATGGEDVKRMVRGFLDGQFKPDKKAYKSFISRYAYRIDGHAVDRCLSFIKGLE
jgi:hypothetical protein